MERNIKILLDSVFQNDLVSLLEMLLETTRLIVRVQRVINAPRKGALNSFQKLFFCLKELSSNRISKALLIFSHLQNKM
jgi:hypothetical protein